MVTQQISQQYRSMDSPIDSKKLIWILSSVIILIVSLTIFQDFLESHRSGHSFYFSESILFKTIWFLFIPIMAVLHKMLKSENLHTLHKIAFFIIGPVIIHLITLSFIVLVLSIFFYEGRYGLYKIVTYTLANDFYILVLIYGIFVFGYRYLPTSIITDISNRKTYLENIFIINGKQNTIVTVNDILHITSATPYISIQLESKKYLHTETLKSIYYQLNHASFVRVHKSTIVNINKVVSFKSRLNGDYDLLLKNGDEIRLSRTYATQFKKLLKTNYQVTA